MHLFGRLDINTTGIHLLLEPKSVFEQNQIIFTVSKFVFRAYPISVTACFPRMNMHSLTYVEACR